MGLVRGFCSLVGRVALCAIFLTSAVFNKIPRFGETVDQMAAVGIPQPKVMLVGAIVFLLVGSLFVITGYAARWGSLLLLIFLVAATYYFHPFWKFGPEDPQHQPQMIQFMKNLAIGGALLMILANGAGKWSWRSRADEDEEDLDY